jgi:hypothetical protein
MENDSSIKELARACFDDIDRVICNLAAGERKAAVDILNCMRTELLKLATEKEEEN